MRILIFSMFDAKNGEIFCHEITWTTLCIRMLNSTLKLDGITDYKTFHKCQSNRIKRREKGHNSQCKNSWRNSGLVTVHIQIYMELIQEGLQNG